MSGGGDSGGGDSGRGVPDVGDAGCTDRGGRGVSHGGGDSNRVGRGVRDGGGAGCTDRGGRGSSDRGGGKLFADVRFKLVGFAEMVEKQFKEELEKRGAEQGSFNAAERKCSHIIVSTNHIAYYHPLCVKGREHGCHVLNDLWLQHSLHLGRPVSLTNVLYRPKFSLNGVEGSKDVILSCEGYGDHFIYLQDIASLLGIQIYQELRKDSTHLMSYSSEGQPYEKARKQGLSIVTSTWLYDCLSEWKILPPKSNLQNDSSLDYHEIIQCHGKDFSTPPSKVASVTKTIRKSKSAGGKINLIHMSKDLAPKSKKFLEFKKESDCVKLLSYASSRNKLVECIMLPASVVAVELTKYFFKCVLKNAYSELIEKQRQNRSLAGKLSAENFSVSKVTGSVEICGFIPEPSSEDNCNADMTSFVIMIRRLFDNDVPVDVEVWLQGISAGWDTNLLLNLANMAHPSNGYSFFQPMYHCMLKMKFHHPEDYKTLLILLEEYNTWKSATFNWLTLELNKEYYNVSKKRVNNYPENSEGLVMNIRDTFEHSGKAYTKDFLDVLMGEFPNLLANLQRSLHKLGFLPEIDFKAPSAERNNRRCRTSGENKKEVQSAKLESANDMSLQIYASDRGKLIDPAAAYGTELTEPFFKAFLLKSFVLMIQQHRIKKRSLAGNVKPHYFWFLEASSAVELRDIETGPLTSVLLNADKESFVEMVKVLYRNRVPVDVAYWLECISKGWDDNILCHFITMAHPDRAYGHFQSLYHTVIKLEKFELEDYKTLLKKMAGYNNWQRSVSYKWEVLEKGKDGYSEDIQGLLDNIRDAFETQRKVDPCTDDFLDAVLADHPHMLANLQKVLYDMGLLPQLDWRTAA